MRQGVADIINHTLIEMRLPAENETQVHEGVTPAEG